MIDNQESTKYIQYIKDSKKERIFTFLQGSHKDLGENSPINVLCEDIFRNIVKFI